MSSGKAAEEAEDADQPRRREEHEGRAEYHDQDNIRTECVFVRPVSPWFVCVLCCLRSLDYDLDRRRRAASVRMTARAPTIGATRCGCSMLLVYRLERRVWPLQFRPRSPPSSGNGW